MNTLFILFRVLMVGSSGVGKTALCSQFVSSDDKPNAYLKIGTVDQNIIATIKMRNSFCYPLYIVIFPILR